MTRATNSGKLAHAIQGAARRAGLETPLYPVCLNIAQLSEQEDFTGKTRGEIATILFERNRKALGAPEMARLIGEPIKLVVLESPFASSSVFSEGGNVDYARRCMHDSMARGEFPFASHLLYTQAGILDDTNPAERKLGIAAGFAWGENASKRVFYVDRGVSSGMKMGAQEALRLSQEIEIRALDREVTEADKERLLREGS